MNVLISISYNGSEFSGYQSQPNKRTIQGCLEDVLKQIFGSEIKTISSGRTDAGVHAYNQYVHFKINHYDLSLLQYKLNKMLPNDIRVNTIREVPEGFNARLSCVEKKYKYVIQLGSHNPFKNGLVYDCYDKLNKNKLFNIAKVFEGKHNFKNYTSKTEDTRGFIRVITDIKFEQFVDILEITFIGSGFMKYEVRMLVGNMLAYAAGKITRKEIITRLNNDQRDITNYCAPACGLYLMDVKYILDKGITYCYHTHTSRCGHAIGTDEEYVLHAIDNGFKNLGFSDHVFLKGIHHPGMRGDFTELDDYVDSINNLKEKYKDKIKIYVGFEAEYNREFIDEYKELLKNKIDYLILGQHCYYDDEGNVHWYTRSPNNFADREDYVNDLIEGMASGLFTYVCHPDLFFQGISEEDPIIDELCKRICEASLKYDIPLEINLGGWNYYGRVTSKAGNYKPSPYPNERFWKIASAYQCKCVIGVDAHNPLDFDKSAFDLAFKLIDKFALNYISNFKIHK